MRILIVCFIILISGCSKESQFTKALDAFVPKNEACSIMRVNEGNLFYCETPNLEVLKVKLMGVAIYEGNEEEAREFTRSILKFGSNVWISLEDRVRENKGVLSAFVYLQDKTFLNALIIREGIGYESFKGKEAGYKNKFDTIYYKELSDPQDVEIEIEEEIEIEDEEKAPWLR